MGERVYGRWFVLAFAALVAAIGAAYFAFSRSYPYYLIWDMDHTTVVDLLVVQSGWIPSHIHHPAFGMYFVLKLTHKLAAALGCVSLGSMGDVARSLNPMFGVAELTQFFRAHSPVVALLTVVSLWTAAGTAFGLPGSALALGLLAYLASTQGLFFQSAVVRSELYALFAWSLALAAAAWAGREARPRRLTGALLLTGVLLGVSFLAKLQSLFHLFAVPLVFGLVRSSSGLKLPEPPRWLRSFVLATTALFVFLLIGGAVIDVPADLATFTHTYRLNPQAVIFLALFGAMLAVRLGGRRVVSFDRRLASAWPLHLLLGGLVLAFLLHFVVVGTTHYAYKYMLYDAKMLFFRNVSDQDVLLPVSMVQAFWSGLRLNPVSYGAAYGLGLLLFWRKRGFEGWSCLALVGLAFVSIIIGSRGSFQDLLWRELFVMFLAVFFSLKLLSERPRRSARRWHWAFGFGLAAASGLNLCQLSTVRARLDSHFIWGGWQRGFAVNSVYGGRQAEYDLAIEDVFGKKRDTRQRSLALDAAPDYGEAARAASFVFANQRISLRNVGLVAEGFRAWVEAPNWRIAEVPANLRAAWLVDNTSLPVRDFVFRLDYVRRAVATYEKLAGANSRQVISVLPRPDLEIYFFSDEPWPDPEQRRFLRPTGQRIVVEASYGERRALVGSLVEQSLELDPRQLKSRSFFVIRRKPL